MDLGKKRRSNKWFSFIAGFLPILSHEAADKCTLVHDYISFIHTNGISINKAKIPVDLAPY